ncbi:PQQ-dependent sugar dehydrogenase [Lyngbya confervoides]|uniref:PQQ-dependent sugar dehydrogenase n=1 Tax=Lyngbya confervoides BDU141951 TaxID=1574623 RepID=A0ABD4T1L7_9CYAN|nr:PQQ-dependent sugar dehydrogenase [Lyngbya confervoides]MCM1982348.1 PQQ-dependent sugar dehydrogenase [Lyngbya confervoides BDU141951]
MRGFAIAQAFLIGIALTGLTTGCGEGLEFFSRAELSSATQTEAVKVQRTTLIDGLDHPWGMVWLPSGEVLVTERSGQIQLINLEQATKQAVSGLPSVFAAGQGGLLDIALHPQFEENQLIYFTYSQGDRDQNKTQVARAQYREGQISNWEVIFANRAAKSSTQHFGSRLLWLPDQTLLVSIGDGGNPPIRYQGDLIRQQAQDPTNHFGKIIRIQEDGSVPQDNPTLSAEGSQPEIWSLGHRNIQGLALDPVTQQVWATEHGSRGGDELNLIQAGENYGWPLVSHSREYTSDQRVAPVSSKPGYVDPKLVWTPSIAPSGLALYRGDRLAAWEGNLFAGALVNQSVVRIQVNPDNSTQAVEEIPIGQRVRDVRQGPDGLLYVLTDSSNGQLIQLAPQS